MVGFSDNVAGLDDAVEEHTCDPATYRPKAGGPDVPDVPVQLDFPAEEQRLVDSAIIRELPSIRVRASRVAALHKGDRFGLDGFWWQVSSEPTRPGDGRWWVADVTRAGPL